MVTVSGSTLVVREVPAEDALHGVDRQLAGPHLRARERALRGELGAVSAMCAFPDLDEYTPVLPCQPDRGHRNNSEDSLIVLQDQVALAPVDFVCKLDEALPQRERRPLAVLLQKVQCRLRHEDARLQPHRVDDAHVVDRFRRREVGQVLRGFPAHGLAERGAVVPRQYPDVRVRVQDLDEPLGVDREQLAGCRGLAHPAVEPPGPQRHLGDPLALVRLLPQPVRGPAREHVLVGRQLVVEGAPVHDVGLKRHVAWLEHDLPGVVLPVREGAVAELSHEHAVHRGRRLEKPMFQHVLSVDVVPQFRAHGGRQGLKQVHVLLREPLHPRYPRHDLVDNGHGEPRRDVVLVEELPQELELRLLLPVRQLELHQRGRERGDEDAPEEEAEEDHEDRAHELDARRRHHDALPGHDRAHGPVEAEQVVEHVLGLDVVVVVPRRRSQLHGDLPQAAAQVVDPQDQEEQLADAHGELDVLGHAPLAHQVDYSVAEVRGFAGAHRRCEAQEPVELQQAHNPDQRVRP
mmetsp:Transcript_57929/g.163559  ORF Transcript_57929/g.163559 Transcript_57929/m.163559 type:complete len:519 (-) Transcript_57929:890-2446(-)